MKDIAKQLQPITDFLRQYGVTMIIIIIGLVYAYLIYTSGKLASVEPSDTQVSEKYKGAKRPKLEEVVVDKLNELEDTNVRYQALVDQARQNPFQE